MNEDDSLYTTNPLSGKRQRQGSGSPQPSEWIPDSALEALNLERDLDPNNTGLTDSPEELAKSIFRNNAPMAAMSITHLAMNSSNENTRLKAAQYVTERALGSLTNPVPTDKGNPWDEILDNIVKDTDKDFVEQTKSTIAATTQGINLAGTEGSVQE